MNKEIRYWMFKICIFSHVALLDENMSAKLARSNPSRLTVFCGVNSKIDYVSTLKNENFYCGNHFFNGSGYFKLEWSEMQILITNQFSKSLKCMCISTNNPFWSLQFNWCYYFNIRVKKLYTSKYVSKSILNQDMVTTIETILNNYCFIEKPKT